LVRDRVRDPYPLTRPHKPYGNNLCSGDQLRGERLGNVSINTTEMRDRRFSEALPVLVQELKLCQIVASLTPETW
jgi:hypothetical protein